MLYHSLLLASTNKRRREGLSGLVNAVGLDQKKLALAESKEWLAAHRIGALTEHTSHFFLLANKDLPRALIADSLAVSMPHTLRQ